MSTYNLLDYQVEYLNHKDLDNIYEQLTIDSIVKLLKQIKRNTQYVPTTLGGQLGDLCFYVTTPEYNVIPGAAPFIRLIDPGTFTLVQNLGPAT